MGVLRGLAVLVVAAIGVLVAVGLLARFSDGPIAIFPGGPLYEGELVPGSVDDWSFASDVEEIELQLVDPPRSRTVWIVVQGGQAYISCGSLNVPLWKQWPHEALEDGRAVVRVEGRRYETQLARVDDQTVRQQVGALVAEKYGAPGGEGPGENVWIFRIDPRPAT